MILLKFKIKAKAGAVADIRIVSAMANHFEAMVEIPLKTTDGKLTVTAEKAGLALDTQSLLIGGGIGLAAVLLLVVLVARARKKS